MKIKIAFFVMLMIISLLTVSITSIDDVNAEKCMENYALVRINLAKTLHHISQKCLEADQKNHSRSEFSNLYLKI